MRTPAEPFEPAQRDPRKLRKTALWLVVIMVVSGVTVLASYLKWLERKADDDRPAIVGRLDAQKELGFVRHDGTAGKLSDWFGDVWIVCGVSVSQPESWKTAREVLKRVNERYAERGDFHILCLTVDPGNEGPEVLAPVAAELGAKIPAWVFAGAGESFVHKFLKNTLKLGHLPHRDQAGNWVYDASLVVIDRDRHLRQATVFRGKRSRRNVPFDFEEAARWDAEGRTEGLEKSNVETLEEMLVKLLDDLLAQPVTDL